MNEVPTRMLRDTLRALTPPGSSSDCMDADALAAWSDGTLSARERAALEAHASGCARCQALLAAMARTASPAPARRWWHTSTVRWLVPLTAAAAAVALWISVPRPAVERPLAPPLASSATAPASSGAANPTAVPRAAERKEEQRADAAAVAAQPVRPRSRRPNVAQDVTRDAAAAAPPAAPARAEARSQIAAAEAAPPSIAGVTPPAPSPMPSTAARAMDQAAPGARRQLMAKEVAVQTAIVSPNPDIRWRVLTGGDVERTIDGGRIWQMQSTGVPVTLTAGAAPAPTICWLVGPGGVVVLSTDGRAWQRVPFPESIDLTSVRASDGAHATVTAADGRTFVTVDGGKTWQSA